MSSSPDQFGSVEFSEPQVAAIARIVAKTVVSEVSSLMRGSSTGATHTAPNQAPTVSLDKEQLPLDSPAQMTTEPVAPPPPPAKLRVVPTFHSDTYPVPIGTLSNGEPVTEYMTVLGPRDYVELPVADMALCAIIQNGEKFQTQAVATVMPIALKSEASPDLHFVNISVDIRSGKAGRLPPFQIMPGSILSSPLVEGLASNDDCDEDPYIQDVTKAVRELQDRSVVLADVSPRQANMPPIVTLSGPQRKDSTYYAGLMVDAQANGTTKYVPLNPETSAAIDQGIISMIGYLGIEANGEATLYGPLALEPEDSPVQPVLRCLLIQSSQPPKIGTPEPKFIADMRSDMRAVSSQPAGTQQLTYTVSGEDAAVDEEDTSSQTVDWGNAFGEDIDSLQAAAGSGRRRFGRLRR